MDMTNFNNESSSKPLYVNEESPATAAEIALGCREFQEEWAGTASISSGLSLIRRPDALSLDYKIAYTPGPINLGDFTAGPLNRVWKCYNQLGNVYIQRANDANTAWEAPQLVFAYALPDVDELDVAFNQSAQVFVCAERPTGLLGSSEIWIYWFDPFAGDYVFSNLGEGRAPKVGLDDFADVTNSDLLIFYFKANGNLVYRQQRDRYTIEYAVGINEPYGYVEDVYQSADFRLTVLYSVRVPATGKYRVFKFATSFYPITASVEDVKVTVAVLDGELLTVVIPYGHEAPSDGFTLEEVQLIQSIASIDIRDVIFVIDDTSLPTHIDLEDAQLTLSIPSIQITGTGQTIIHTVYDMEDGQIGTSIQSITLVTVVISHTAYDIEDAKITHAIQSITLV